jgi:RNA polymerase sigma factor (sigma-70 family)
MLGRGSTTLTKFRSTFEREVTALFNAQFQRIFRVLHRFSGDADVASDLAQEAFVRLYRRGEMPDAPSAWLVTVSLNLMRSMRSRDARRLEILTSSGFEGEHVDDAALADHAMVRAETARSVRQTLDRMPPRQAQLLLLSVEGFSYREISAMLEMHEASVGVALGRAKKVFRDKHESLLDAS